MASKKYTLLISFLCLMTSGLLAQDMGGYDVRTSSHVPTDPVKLRRLMCLEMDEGERLDAEEVRDNALAVSGLVIDGEGPPELPRGIPRTSNS